MPIPTEFLAEIRKIYVVAAERPVTFLEVAVDAGEENVSQVIPPLDEYCTR